MYIGIALASERVPLLVLTSPKLILRPNHQTLIDFDVIQHWEHGRTDPSRWSSLPTNLPQVISRHPPYTRQSVPMLSVVFILTMRDNEDTENYHPTHRHRRPRATPSNIPDERKYNSLHTCTKRSVCHRYVALATPLLDMIRFTAMARPGL